ncbi:hypothetical protein RJ639_034696 [Escallonia herrerae]|uniref:MACPF domain-containing protein n=1 Tax=Escallonia herrerae TaxID=1293975 RepID=A0AA88WXL1_9ASTE|nr:hypothetical protein RJ639_034696 [Escallonia herrerae]
MGARLDELESAMLGGRMGAVLGGRGSMGAMLGGRMGAVLGGRMGAVLGGHRGTTAFDYIHLYKHLHTCSVFVNCPNAKMSEHCQSLEINGAGPTFMDSSATSSYLHKEDITLVWRRRGGSNNRKLAHHKWCQTVQLEPDVISMSFVPISSLLSGVHGSGYLSHAINLYLRCEKEIYLLLAIILSWELLSQQRPHPGFAMLKWCNSVGGYLWRQYWVDGGGGIGDAGDVVRLGCSGESRRFGGTSDGDGFAVVSVAVVSGGGHRSSSDGYDGNIGVAVAAADGDKPPIEELYQFLEFQLPRQWAPVFGELAVGPERKQQSGASLQFSFMGPKLHVNTSLVDVGNRPVTGLRLYLEGKRNNCLAVHLQHLSSLPKSFQLQDEANGSSRNSYDRRYYEKVLWKSFSHVCTAPVESDEDLCVVTKARFEVKDSGLKRVLFLRLHFSRVIGALVVKKPEWDGSPVLSQKSGVISTLISTHFSTGQKPPPQPSDVNINSAVYPGGPPLPAHAAKLLRFVDTTEMARGPQDPPGYWVVSGARLVVDKGKISLRVKYSLLAVTSPDEEMSLEL